jgi:CheY-like chemotaxis protein
MAGEMPLILIVEDHQDNILLLVDYLESKGYRIAVAYNGAQALEMLGHLHPSLVLMDMHMPVMGGLEAMRIMRSDSRYKRLPIIALTALAMVGDRERCLQAGADDYMSKPVSLHGLLEMIARHLRSTP